MDGIDLKNFEQKISSTILKRGFDYFASGLVEGLENLSDGRWLAHVLGKDSYTVHVNILKTKIQGWDCDCPYNQGPACKHVVAVLHAINEQNKPGEAPTNMRKKKNQVQDIFTKTSKEDLQEFILEHFMKDADMKNTFVTHFSEYLDEDLGQKYKTIVRNIYNSVKGRHGFIDYYSAPSLINPLYNLAIKANQLLTDNNVKESLSICKALIENVPVYLNNMDDSDGSAGDLLHYTFDTFVSSSQQAPTILKEELFSYCIKEFPKEKYHGFGFETNFLYLLPELISHKEQEIKFFELIDRQIEHQKKQPYSDYGIVQLIKAKVEYLLKTGNEEVAQDLINHNIKFPEIREILVDKSITLKDYEQAKVLCKEGITEAEKINLSGVVRKWQQKLLDIAKTEQDISAIRKWTEKLFFEDHFSMYYYRELKATYNNEEWAAICESLISRIEKIHKQWPRDMSRVLAAIYTEEKFSQRLLKLLQEQPVNLYDMDKLTPDLIKTHPNEVLDLYEKGIKNYATQAGRRYYREIAGYLKRIKMIKGGDEKVYAIIRYFRTQYRNRPAMMEVLDKHFPETIVK